MGFPAIKRDGPWAEIDANGLNIGLNGREPEEVHTESNPIITFQPETGLEAAVEELKGRGVEFSVEIKDSEGNDLQLYERPSS